MGSDWETVSVEKLGQQDLNQGSNGRPCHLNESLHWGLEAYFEPDYKCAPRPSGYFWDTSNLQLFSIVGRNTLKRSVWMIPWAIYNSDSSLRNLTWFVEWHQLFPQPPPTSEIRWAISLWLESDKQGGLPPDCCRFATWPTSQNRAKLSAELEIKSFHKKVLSFKRKHHVKLFSSNICSVQKCAGMCSQKYATDFTQRM